MIRLKVILQHTECKELLPMLINILYNNYELFFIFVPTLNAAYFN
jgi:hypothetical protein